MFRNKKFNKLLEECGGYFAIIAKPFVLLLKICLIVIAFPFWLLNLTEENEDGIKTIILFVIALMSILAWIMVSDFQDRKAVKSACFDNIEQCEAVAYELFVDVSLTTEDEYEELVDNRPSDVFRDNVTNIADYGSNCSTNTEDLYIKFDIVNTTNPSNFYKPEAKNVILANYVRRFDDLCESGLFITSVIGKSVNLFFIPIKADETRVYGLLCLGRIDPDACGKYPLLRSEIFDISLSDKTIYDFTKLWKDE